MNLNWYVVHAFSGYENQVKRSLEDRIKLERMNDKFGQILVPTEEVVEMKDGQKRKSDRKFFPGYVLVEMVMDDDSWHLVKSCPKVMGFIGGSSDMPGQGRGSRGLCGPSPSSDAILSAYMNTTQGSSK